MSKKDVLLYALSTCIHCRNTKKFLEEKNIPYDCVEVDTLTGEERKKAIEEVKKHNADCSFPTMVIDGGKCVIVGFNKERIQEELCP